MTDQIAMTEANTFQGCATKRISYVLPTKNRAQFIGKALDGAKHLVGPEDELIVVDGGSTDGTVEIIAGYGGLVDLFISEPDLNASHASNKGMLVARGRYINWFTDDDEYFPEAMEQAVGVLDAHPEIDILLCGGTRRVGETIIPVYVPPGTNYGLSAEDIFRHTGSGMGILIRRNVLSQIGLVDQHNMASDGEFLARAMAYGLNVKFCRINLYYHPIYEHSTITFHLEVWQRDMNRIAKQYCSLWFYMKYRIKGAILRSSVLGRPAIRMRGALRGLVAWIAGRGDGKPPEPLIWDGGFS